MDKKIIEYHTYHGDRDVEIVGKVENKGKDYDLMLVRFKDENGTEYSALDDYRDYVSEIYSCTRESESDMIACFYDCEEKL